MIILRNLSLCTVVSASITEHTDPVLDYLALLADHNYIKTHVLKNRESSSSGSSVASISDAGISDVGSADVEDVSLRLDNADYSNLAHATYEQIKSMVSKAGIADVTLLPISSDKKTFMEANSIEGNSILDAVKSIMRRGLRGIVADDNLPFVSKLYNGHEAHYPTLEEGLALLDQWVTDYPTLIKRSSIGKSLEERELYMYTVGANVDSTPKMLLTGLTHSREPAGLVTILYFLGQMLNQKDKDAEAAYLLTERTLYVVPFVNPDGYVFNLKSRSKMKRKNMRNTCPRRIEDGGVDLNRNFATHWKRVPNGCSEEHSGTKPFSEPESAALRDLILKHKETTSPFRIGCNLHSYGSMLTHPYNYERHNTLPPDQLLIYKEINRVFKYRKFGTAQETVGYTAFGESDDWMYDQGMIAMSPEVGHEEDGFWPRQNKILGICKRNFIRMAYLAYKSGCELVLNKNGKELTVYNRGLDVCKSPTVAVQFSSAVDITITNGDGETMDELHVTSDGKTSVFTSKKDIPSRGKIAYNLNAITSMSTDADVTGATVKFCSLGSYRIGESCQCKDNLPDEAKFATANGSDDLCNAASGRRSAYLIAANKGLPVLPGGKVEAIAEKSFAKSLMKGPLKAAVQTAPPATSEPPAKSATAAPATPTPAPVVTPATAAPSTSGSTMVVDGMNAFSRKPPAVNESLRGFFHFGNKIRYEVMYCLVFLFFLIMILIGCNIYMCFRWCFGYESVRHVKLVDDALDLQGRSDGSDPKVEFDGSKVDPDTFTIEDEE